jgi:hypothetical protein
MSRFTQAISRRRFLQATGAASLGAATPGIVMARDGGALRSSKEKSCIYILLCGGASHLDTWDLKPDAPEDIRGPYKPIQTSVPGMRICELAPRLAKHGQDFSVIRSMHHPGAISNHFDAMHNSLSGQETPPADAPYMGSILAKFRPTQKTVAPYVWLIKCVGDPVFCAPNIGTGGSLGSHYAPLFVGSAANNPASPNFEPPELFSKASEDRMSDRRKLLEKMDTRGNERPITREWETMHRQAFDMATSAAARRAFEINREDPKTRDRYGRHPLGQNLLLARRLVESGVGMVVVNGWTGPAPNEKGGGPPASSWDMHGGGMGMGNAFGGGSYGMGWCLPRLDEALSALYADLKERGLLENTLVICTTEFGRTPQISKSGPPGRAHWTACYSTLIGGGGVRGGQVYGESDKNGAYVKDRPVRPSDMAATIYYSLGMPLDPRLSKDGVTKPLTPGRPIMGLF